MTKSKKYQTDWLASDPVFYNTETKKVSKNINDVINFKNLEFHPEGLNNYLEFGYSVFEQTPVKNVKFLRHSSVLTITPDNDLQLEYLPDKIQEMPSKQTEEKDVLALIKAKINQWEDKTQGEIIIPTSGGYDSRLLNFFINNKNRIRSFTYGISKNQEKSHEVVFAKKLSNILGTKWEMINLGNFHKHINIWIDLYGISTHAHGMYHIEFYKKISKKIHSKPLLSGIIGDAWSGNVNIKPITAPEHLIRLGYSHGMSADKNQSLLKSDNELREKYFITNKEKFSNKKWLIIEAIRTKMILLSYLFKIPKHFGLEPWSPFLDFEIATSMLNLPQERLEQRIWQKEFYKKNSIDLENQKLKCSMQNILNYNTIKKYPIEPLNIKLLSELIKIPYLKWINERLAPLTPLQKIINYFSPRTILLKIPKVRGVLLKIGLLTKPEKETLKAYNAYLTLKPIESLISKREN